MKRSVIRIVGAGPTGALLAILLAAPRTSRDRAVRNAAPIRSRRARSRADPSIWRWPIAAFTRSKSAGVFDDLEPALLPMRGRLIHYENRRHGVSALRAAAQRSDLFGVAAPAQPGADRSRRPGCRACSCISSIDSRRRISPRDTAQIRDLQHDRLISVPMQPLLATDGAGSAMRREMSAQNLIQASETDLEHGYKELSIPAGSRRQLSHGERCAAYLAARQLHADRAAKRGRQLHGDAVPARSADRSVSSR